MLVGSRNCFQNKLGRALGDQPPDASDTEFHCSTDRFPECVDGSLLRTPARDLVEVFEMIAFPINTLVNRPRNESPEPMYLAGLSRQNHRALWQLRRRS
jgi:hypothetical protein